MLWHSNVSQNLHCHHPVCVLVQVPAAPLVIQLRARVSSKAEEHNRSVWAIVTHVSDGVPGCWLWPGLVPVVVGMWRINQEMDGR